MMLDVVDFCEVLPSEVISPDLSQNADLYGWLIGSWEVDLIDYDLGASPHKSKGEWHFSRVLEGRAIQDVFIVPVRGSRDGVGKEGNRYGTTLRFYDPTIDAWRITWFNPVRTVKNELIARRKGNDIVQDGKLDDGTLMRWSFVDIKPDSFRWLGENSDDGGKTWVLGAEFLAKRKSK
jgi:hypothetical protein